MTITTTDELKFENLFVDGDTRNFTLKNPRADITTADIETLNTYMQQKNIILGDKYGATFGRISHVTHIIKTTRTLDI